MTRQGGLDLEAMALAMPEVDGHPNRRAFRGVLTLVSVASDRPPAGARGHRVLLTRAAVERALPSLLGMAIDYTPRMDGHDTRTKIGVITEADLANQCGRQVVTVSGHVFEHDFPELIRELDAMRGELGMSYEIAGAHVQEATPGVWAITEFSFTGAAVLRREKAAYRSTSFEITREHSA